MLNKLRKINLRKAGICSCFAGAMNILVHILVMLQAIPYTWVNGGRTESLLAARQISESSIVMTLINIVIALAASKIIPIRLNSVCAIALSVFLIVTLPLSFIGVIQQFFGTVFEKCIMSLIAIIGFCSDTRIAFEKRW